ncbi:MAG: nucleoside triphosphate pyrophosphohydrolase [Eubacteriales bacterium]|nr:nucleoside triphosphate pyrophosphohydrolase [Eubacteriales bacterium]
MTTPAPQFDLNATTFTVKDTYTIDELRTIMAFLRSENGCPWDKVQTHDSIKKNLLEEAYEAIDAIDSGVPAQLADELGDVLMQVVFHAQMASETDQFDFDTVVSNICRKLISRHTHLFGEDQAKTPEAVLDNWEKNKRKEKGHQNQSQVLVDVPRSLPALQRGFKVQQKAAQVGFDWDTPEGPREKITEELLEIEEILQHTQTLQARGEMTAEHAGREVAAEVGDLLFAVVNYARHLKVQPEIALTHTTDKFIRRFSQMEILAAEDGVELDELSLSELDALWEAAKDLERLAKNQEAQ